MTASLAICCGSLGSRLPLVEEQPDHLSRSDGVTGADAEVAHRARRVRLYLDGGLVGVDLEERITRLDDIALGAEPADEDELHAYLAELGHDDLVCHDPRPTSSLARLLRYRRPTE